MGILSGVAPIGSLIKLATGVMLQRHHGRAEKANVEFSEALRERMAAVGSKRAQGMEQVGEVASRSAERLIAYLDADGDGQLSPSELGMGGEAFGRVDLDGDGLVGKAELTRAYVERVRPAAGWLEPLV